MKRFINRKFIKKFILVKTVFVLTGMAAFCGFSYAAKGVSEVPCIHSCNPPEPIESDTIKVMTLNIAHGRGASFHQLFMRQKTIKSNLTRIADVIKRENPDICALQESDARSFYSDELHHGQYLVEHTDMAECIQGRHVKGMNFIYGTGLLSKAQLSDAASQVFPYKAPNPTKGFVTACVKIKDIEVDIVSIHLDFLHRKLRQKQVDILVKSLEDRGRPVIIMGDFNCSYHDKSVLKEVCVRLNLSTWKPEEKTPTFAKTKKRLDWILVSDPFEIISSEVLSDTLSDHAAVTAVIRLK